MRTHFRMPDILALGLGGGSVVSSAVDQVVSIGPRSVGHQLEEKALIFGGDTLTASDIAVAAGYADFGDPGKVRHLSSECVGACVDKIHRMIEDGIDRMKTNAMPIPLILVGGGAVLIDPRRNLEGVSEVMIPEDAGVANAIGASIAQVGSEVTTVAFYEKVDREQAMEQVRQNAIAQAVDAGAVAETVEVLSIDETPLAYAPDGAVRLHIKVAGDLKMAAG